MIDQSDFHELVSGRRRGALAGLARGLLRVAEVAYTLAVRVRNRRYDHNAAAAERVDVPIVCVGNLTLGGTGKTPMVKWLARWFAERGVRVAIVSRGYGSAGGKQNDEALELAQALPNVPQVQDTDRVAGARRAIAEFGSQLILLDDGFQHRRLARDLDIVLLDATAPFGFDHVFPRGTLREPATGIRRAAVVCLTRSDLLDDSGRGAIRERVASLTPQAVWCEAAHSPQGLLNSTGETQSLAGLSGRRVAAFCGIGNPAAFRRALESAGCQIVAWREFPDHHIYDAADRGEMAQVIVASGPELVVTTHKDLVKLPIDDLGKRPLWALTVEMEFLAGGDALTNSLEPILRRALGNQSPRR
jgi:tetraacyldisaccharide 4'-kinase